MVIQWFSFISNYPINNLHDAKRLFFSQSISTSIRIFKVRKNKYVRSPFVACVALTGESPRHQYKCIKDKLMPQ